MYNGCGVTFTHFAQSSKTGTVTKGFDAMANRPLLVFDSRTLWRSTLSDRVPERQKLTRVFAAADRPARRSGSAHAEYSVLHHMVIKPSLLLGLAAEYRSRRWVWSTVVRRPSEVYDTHRRTKLTAPETISRSTDMVGAHQNLNG